MIRLPEGYFLDEPNPTDRDAYVKWLSDPYYSTVIPVLPCPYTTSDADWWVTHSAERKANHGNDPTLAIRDPEGKLVGLVGIDQMTPGDFRAEFGYWLARPHWGKGIMTSAVQTYCGYAFSTLGLGRLHAHVLDFNIASCRVLEKAGFQKEGYLRKHVESRKGRFDVHLYGLLKEEFELGLLNQVRL